jgi:hypothetical protein
MCDGGSGPLSLIWVRLCDIIFMVNIASQYNESHYTAVLQSQISRALWRYRSFSPSYKMSCLFSVSVSSFHRFFYAIRGNHSSYVSFDLKDDNVILVASLLLTRFVQWAAAHALIRECLTVLRLGGSGEVHDAIFYLILFHFKAIVAKAFGSALNHIDSRSLAVPVPFVDLCGSHVKEASHFSHLEWRPERVSLELTGE